jgi:hypothetical protein
MKNTGQPKIMHARQVCSQINARAVIVIALNEESVAGASYAQTKEECGEAGKTLDEIIDLIERGEIKTWGRRTGLPKAYSADDPDRAKLFTSLKAIFAEWDESLSNGCNDGNALKYLEKHDPDAAAVYRDAVAAIQKAEGRTV